MDTNVKKNKNHRRNNNSQAFKNNNSQVPPKRRIIHFKTKPMVEELKRNQRGDGTETPTDKKKGTKMGTYRKAFAEYEKIKAEKIQKKEASIKRMTEIKESLEKYKQKKRDKTKKLSAKTKKGQPLMKNRIEMLLEKIQSSRQ